MAEPEKKPSLEKIPSPEKKPVSVKEVAPPKGTMGILQQTLFVILNFMFQFVKLLLSFFIVCPVFVKSSPS